MAADGITIGLRAHNGGRFISRGRGAHPDRIIDSWELIFVLRDTLRMTVGGEDFDVPAGAALLIPPGVRHRGRGDFAPRLSFFWVHFAAADPDPEERRGTLLPVAAPERLSNYFQCFLELQENAPDDRRGLDLLLALIVHEARKMPTAGGVAPGRTPRLVQAAERIMALRFREPLSTSVIARELQCDPDYLGRLFRAATGGCLTDALNDLRLRHAVELLNNSNLTVAEVAAEVGFGDASYFRRRFFRRYAQTPTAFRRRRNAEHVNTR